MITLARLRQVVALAEQGSFGKAAAMLNISQPALTKNIRALEVALGVRLFDRLPRGVALTDFGRLVLAHTRDVDGRERELLREIQLLAGLEVGQLEVLLGPHPSVMSGYAALGRMSRMHPKLKIGIHVANWRAVTRAVAAKEAELGIAELSDAVLNEHLDTEIVGKHRARIFCRPGHPLLKVERVTMPLLLSFPWANTRLPPRVAAAFPREPVAAGRIDELTEDFVPAVEIDVPMQLARLVEGSDMITFGTFSVVENELESGRLAYVPTPQIDVRGSYGFIYLRGRSLSPAARAYMQAVRDEEQLCREREVALEARFTQRRSSPTDEMKPESNVAQ